MYDCLKKISDCLDGFEREYSGLHTQKNKNLLIKEEYTRRLIKK